MMYMPVVPEYFKVAKMFSKTLQYTGLQEMESTELPTENQATLVSSSSTVTTVIKSSTDPPTHLPHPTHWLLATNPPAVVSR